VYPLCVILFNIQGLNICKNSQKIKRIMNPVIYYYGMTLEDAAPAIAKANDC